MHIHFSVQDINDLLAGIHHGKCTQVNLEENEQLFSFPDDICDGWIHRIQLRSGLELLVQNVEFRGNSTRKIEYNNAFSAIEISFYITGDAKVSINSRGQKSNFNSGQYRLGSPVNSTENIEYLAGQRSVFITIYGEPDILGTLNGNQLRQFPSQLQPIIDGRNNLPYFQVGRITSTMKIAIEQILNCSYKAITKRLYLEGKVIELIACSLHQVLSNQDYSRSNLKLQQRDIHCIHQVKSILLSNLDNPPSLFELAKQVNLNSQKLKQGFRQIFGTSVFAYLHEHRMEKARELLKLGNLNVTEVAGTVGYSSLSAFNAAFKRQFGMSPGAYKVHNITSYTDD